LQCKQSGIQQQTKHFETLARFRAINKYDHKVGLYDFLLYGPSTLKKLMYGEATILKSAWIAAPAAVMVYNKENRR
jgi:hypothetical protein